MGKFKAATTIVVKQTAQATRITNPVRSIAAKPAAIRNLVAQPQPTVVKLTTRRTTIVIASNRRPPKTAALVNQPHKAANITTRMAVANLKAAAIVTPPTKQQAREPVRQAVAIKRPRLPMPKKIGRSGSPPITHVTPDQTPNDITKLKSFRDSKAGKILIIVGNGPSVLEVPLEELKGHKLVDVMSINTPDARAWPSAHWAFFDQSQLRRHRALWDDYNGNAFTGTSIKASRPGSVKLKSLGGYGFSTDLIHGIYIGRSSVYAAMQIGLWFGYDHIYAVGVDMTIVDGKTHFYGLNPDVSKEERINRFSKEAEHYDHAAKALPPEVRQRFTFCSSYNQFDFVNKFRHIDHTDFMLDLFEKEKALRHE